MSIVNDQTANPQYLERAGGWLVQSGIQEPFGGVARYYRSDQRKNALVSTEITGYAASALLYLFSRTGHGEYLEPALRAGRFLTRAAWDAPLSAFPFEFAVNGALPERQAFFFDTGIIARALLWLWRTRRDPEFLDTARGSAEAMARDFAAGREYHPILRLPSKQPAPRDSRWSRAPGCYQLKAALAWYDLAGETGKGDLREHYGRLLEYALRDQAAFLPGDEAPDRVMDRLHAFCYFLEGLLPCAGQPECAGALKDGIGRVAALLRRIAPVFERCDVYAQLLRLRLFAAALGVAALDQPAAQEEVLAIAQFQREDPDPRIRGGFHFGRKGGQLLPYLNPVSTAFSVQALEMWREYRAGAFQPDWRTLI